MKRYSIIVIAIVSLVFLGSSEWNHFRGSAAGEEAGSSSVVVTIEHDEFSPEEITVKAGTEVVWKNKDSVPHSVLGANGSFDSGTLVQGAEYKRKFTAAGTFPYSCEIHPFMTGKVEVK